ncbi:MAG: phage tail tape measure protein, partial [Clostridia bacterium]|nr:phage tail tape measure protein [Clostridia bacterium]
MAQVTLQAVVNFEQVNQLQQRIDKLNGSKITIGVQDFTRQMKEAGTATGKVSESLSKVVRVFDANGGLVSGVEKYQKGIGTTVELMQKFNKETEELEQTGSRVIRDLAKEQKAAAKAAEEHAKYVAECNKEYAKYQQYVASMQKNTPIQNRIDALTGVYRDDPVTRKEFTDFGRLLFKQEEQAAKAAEKAAAAQKKEEEATAGANNEVKKQGLLYDVLGRSVSSFLARMVAYRAVYAGIRAITNGFREALETLKAVDDELVTVRKVTGFDSYQMARVEEQAYAVASKYGTSASDYTSSVAAFARAGYKDLSGDLAELAEKTKIVGDTTADVAQQFLLSVDAAYKYKGNIQALTAVLDGANEIDNKYATSIEKIAEGMGIVAPVAAQMNVDVDELAASIGTITAVTQRTGTEAARALRAIYLNIVGDTKTEIEEGVTWTTGEIEGLRDVVKLYAKDAWDAAQASGGIIDPMEAIAGLAKSVKDGVLTEAQLMEMVSDIGGKLRTSQLLALINNWDMYESMLNDYRNAYGSAEKEIENAMDSWSRKSEVLKNTWTQFVKTGLNSDAVKGFLDILIKIVQRLDSLPAVLTRIATIVVGMNLPAIGKSVSTFFSNIKNNGIASLDGLSAAITGVGIAWSVVSYIVEDAKRKHEEAVEKIYEQADAAKESTEKLTNLHEKIYALCNADYTYAWGPAGMTKPAEELKLTSNRVLMSIEGTFGLVSYK